MTRKTLIAALAALLALSPVALANDEDGDEERHEREDEDAIERAKRKVEIETNAQEVKIKLERESGSTEDSVKVEYKANEGTLKVEYEHENATAETETELKVRMLEIVEFRDANGDGGFGKDDAVVRTHDVGSLSWRVDGPQAMEAGGKPGQRITGVGSFPDGGALVLVMYVYGDMTEMNGTSLAPTDVKIDIILDHFPYTADDTLAAIVVKTETETETEIEGSDDEREVVAEANGFAAYFEWAEHALVDDVSQPVVSTMLEDGKDEKKFSLAYARGDYINHDPVLGVQSAGAEKRVPAPGALALGAIVVGVVLLARRR